jgi:hypothetical protein
MPLDTSADAAQVQTEIHRALGGPRRLELACQMSETVRELARARIRSKHPEFDESATRDWLTWELYGVRRNHR